jgi:hypothetical protein
VVGFLFLGSGPERETVYRQWMEMGDREPNPDAWRSIERAADGHSTSMEDVGVDHRRPHVLVTEQFLHGTDVVTVLKQMCGERVPEGVAAHRLVDACQFDRFLDRLL